MPRCRVRRRPGPPLVAGRPAPPRPGRQAWAWSGRPSPALSPPWPGRAVAPRHRRLAARDRPKPGPDPAGMARPGLGPSGSVSCLTVPLLVRAYPAPGSRGCRGARDLTGPPRAPPELSPWPSGVARWAVSSPLRAAVSPHRPSEPCPDFFESYRSSCSPVTESNRRPSPYHACQFRPMPSHRVWLPQFRGISVSGYVALCRPLPGAVVTYFVTDSRTFLPSKCTIVAPGESGARHEHGCHDRLIRCPNRGSAGGLCRCWSRSVHRTGSLGLVEGRRPARQGVQPVVDGSRVRLCRRPLPGPAQAHNPIVTKLSEIAGDG